jgi:Zn-dependent M28 family amino/carboxypeptidase
MTKPFRWSPIRTIRLPLSGSVLVLFLPALVLMLSGCAGSPQDLPPSGVTTEPCSSVAALDLPEEVVSATEAIDADGLLESVKALASDDMEGRGPGSDGDRKAREYLVRRLAAHGYEPAFAGGAYDQRLKIVGITSNMPETWSFQRSGAEAGGQAGGEVSFRFLDEYMGASGVQQPAVKIEDAEVVFVGYGIQAPEESWDDFKGVDLSGKVLLMLNDDPHWDPDLFAGERKLFYGRWTYKYESAARQGAAAAIIIHTTPSAGYPWVVVRTSWNGEQFELEAGDEPRTLLNAWLTEEAATRLAALGGHDLAVLTEQARSREFRPVPLNVQTSLSFSVGVRETETANVAGILRGSDPALADQLVIFSAHHDHLGLGEPDGKGDRIYNGALDNGVAMAQALEVAEAVATLPEPPRRSVMIFFPAAEEQGLLGSAYFARSDAFPPGKMAADINFELGNVWGRTRDVVIFGRGKTTLEDDLEAAALRQERTVTAEKDVRAGWYYRSDQFSLARVGVPAIWFRSGTEFIDRPAGGEENPFAAWIENHYHRPTDEVTDEWVMDGLVEDAQLAFWVGMTVANRDELPEWYPGDEFEDERAAALAAAGLSD